MGSSKPRPRYRYARAITLALSTCWVSAPFAMKAAWAGARGLAERLREGPGILNHPVGVTPSSAIRIPFGWPLTPEGTLGCITCHAALPNLQDGDPQLREAGVPGGPFCARCHESGGEGTSSGVHWRALGRAHWTESSDGARLVGFGVDAASRSCLDCHDGVNAPEAAYQTPWDRGAGSTGDRHRNHPIGVRYPRAGRARAEVPLRPVSQLPASIVLPNDTVGCLSCHNPYARAEKLLTVPIEGSKLCLTCHAME